jgi:hypothetical protein
MKIVKNIFSISLFIILGVASSYSLSFNISRPKEIKLAEPFKLKISIDPPAQNEINLSTENFKSEDFELTKIKKISSSEFEIEAIPFNIGISTFPPLEFIENGKIEATPQLPLEIKPLFDKVEPKIKDIYPPFYFLNWLKLLLYLILILILYFAIRYLINKKNKQNPYKIADFNNAKTPYEIAVSELDKLENKEDISPKQFYIELSQIFRTYLLNRYNIDALKMTTNDSVKNLKNKVNDISIAIKSREVLDISDLAKFAKYAPQKKDMLNSLQECRDLIAKLEDIVIKEEEKKRQEELLKQRGNNAV